MIRSLDRFLKQYLVAVKLQHKQKKKKKHPRILVGNLNIVAAYLFKHIPVFDCSL